MYANFEFKFKLILKIFYDRTNSLYMNYIRRFAKKRTEFVPYNLRFVPSINICWWLGFANRIADKFPTSTCELIEAIKKICVRVPRLNFVLFFQNIFRVLGKIKPYVIILLCQKCFMNCFRGQMFTVVYKLLCTNKGDCDAIG